MEYNNYFFDSEKIAKLFKTTPVNARKLMSSGQIKSRKIGQCYFTTLNNVLNYFERNEGHVEN